MPKKPKKSLPVEAAKTPRSLEEFVPEGLGSLPTEWELQELEIELLELVDTISPQELKALQLWMQGHSYAECLTLAGYEVTDYSKSTAHMLDILRRDTSKKYTEVAKRISTLRALKSETFTELEWLRELRGIVNMATGRQEQAVIGVYNGEIISQMAKKTELTPALRAMELIAKRNAWLIDRTQNSNETTNEVVVSVKDFSGTARTAQLDHVDAIDGELE